MFSLLISVLPFFILLSTSEVRLLSLLFWREFLYFAVCCLRNFREVSFRVFRMSVKMASKRKCAARVENVEESTEMSILDLPDLALECILGKLPPSGLCSMAGVCSSLRDMCRDDHLWERHMREKWGKVIGQAAKREWDWYSASRKESSGGSVERHSTGKHKRSESSGRPKKWVRSLSWPLLWLKSRLDGGGRIRTPLPDNSIMSWYLYLESGKFWFPAQVYNREHGHVGFMLSCYDAELSYDCRTDTFQARYPPHGRRTVVVEDGVQWDRIRAPAVDTPVHDLHISDCLHDLRPGDHIEIQWRRNKEFPYGWWYGIVGHMEPCDGSLHFCRCHQSDSVVLEFNQYTPGSRWRQTTISRKDHRVEGNETDGFYGGIRKLYKKDEISTWKQLWPVEVLE